MLKLAKLLEVICFTFAAWIAAGFLVYAGYSWSGRLWQVSLHCAGVLLTFIPAFTLYYRRPDPLAPPAAAGTALAFIILLDFVFVAPYFLHPLDFFLKFWDWQLPAMLVIASVYSARRVAKA